jgi:hypothetical protein
MVKNRDDTALITMDERGAFVKYYLPAARLKIIPPDEQISL